MQIATRDSYFDTSVISLEINMLLNNLLTINTALIRCIEKYHVNGFLYGELKQYHKTDNHRSVKL